MSFRAVTFASVTVLSNKREIDLGDRCFVYLGGRNGPSCYHSMQQKRSESYQIHKKE